jgi:hypothetical protein
LNKKDAINKIERLLTQAASLAKQQRLNPHFDKWKRDTEIAIERIFGNQERHLKDFTRIRFSQMYATRQTSEHDHQAHYERGMQKAITIFRSFISEIEDYWPK